MKKERENIESKSNVLAFPIKKMIRQKTYKKNQERRAVFGLSILSLFVFTLAVNQWVRDYSLAQSSNRGIASLKAEISEDILGEHTLAKKLAATDNEILGIKSKNPSLKDELLFSFLEGKYKIHSENNRIKEINAGDELVRIEEGSKLLQKYVSLFNETAVQYKLKEKNKLESSREETYELIDKRGIVVDILKVSLDQSGKLNSIKLQ
ncbi:MAG: hypothetical protein L6Q37_02285 [Bdellovibrionaceae bacterium]|nr:hypothetical protein [Pseudobdellovibrionaceae bacterium]NUM57872.1 hypothetical protein [Pseudobdellovibrionaceae bacterium]